LATAAQVVGEEGFEKASIAKLTSAADVAQGIFYTYFPSPQAFVYTSQVSYGAVSNIEAEGKIWNGSRGCRLFLLPSQLWHSDTSDGAVPTKVTLLWAKEATPEGGETEFADTRAAGDDLTSPLSSTTRTTRPARPPVGHD